MARARNIKPGFFKNEILAELPTEVRLLFIGLWTLADREGRLEDRPKRIRAELFAFDGFDVDSMLNELQSKDFVTRYEVGGIRFIQIENFVKHQDPHYKEKASEIPPPPGIENKIVATGVTRTQRARILERDGYTCLACGSKEHLCIDHVLPVSRGGDSSDDNLQVLCLSCNTKKGNKIDGEVKNTSKKGSERLPGPDGFDVESSSTQHQFKESGRNPLTPDSLYSDSLYSDSPTPSAHAAQTARVTEPAKVCKAMKAAGIGDVNPGHPDLLMLLEAGATLAEFEGAALTASGKGKGFAYALGTLKRTRQDAANTAPTLHTGALPAVHRHHPKTFAERDREAGWARWEEQTNRIHPDRIKAQQGQAIDVAPKPLEIAQ